MGSVFAQPLGAGGSWPTRPRPGRRWSPTAARAGRARARRLTLCLGAEREGLPAEVLAACDGAVTIPLRAGGAESLNVAAAAAIACERISSPAPARADGGPR